MAAAAVESGAPVMVHTNAAARTGPLALDALTQAGVDPRKIVVAHAGDSNDLDYLRQLGESGAFLGFDRFNIPHFNPDERRIETVLALLAEGYADRIHFSHDAACFYDFMVGNPAFADERPDYLHITNVILPKLRERGVTDAQIDQIMVDNPRRWLTDNRSDRPRSVTAVRTSLLRGLYFPNALTSSGLTRSGAVQPSRSYSLMHCSTKPLSRSTVPSPCAIQ